MSKYKSRLHSHSLPPARRENFSLAQTLVHPKRKKGQTAETVSWLVATLVIIGILIIFIYVSFLMSKAKAVSIGNLQTDLEKESLVLSEKTSLSENLNSQNKNEINNFLKGVNS